MATAATDAKVIVSFSAPGGGERVVLRSEVPPEAEFGMFEIGEIELGAHEPGRGVRELGYQTTAADARKRLANLGLSGATAREVAQLFQPTLSDAYARGQACRRVARYFTPLELFRSETYDAATRFYRGTFIDLAALSRDLELEHASATIQALYLASLLETEDDETTVLISTDLCTKGSKPGTRTFKRPTFVDTQRLLNALGGLTHRNPQPEIHEALPRVEVVDWLRAQKARAEDDDARALYDSLETAVSVREMPDKGPLASPELWALEQRIEAGQYEGTLDSIDAFERVQGRTPGTTYLRARVSLELRLEPPKLVAERVSALSLSMTSFQELALLASEAWLEAGDARRAMPYARDLVESPTIDDGLRLKAQTLLKRAESNRPRRRMSPTLADPIRAPLPPTRNASELPTSPPPPPPLETEVALPPVDEDPFPDLNVGAPKPVRASRDNVAIPDIPVTEPSMPNDRHPSYPALRAQRPSAAEPAPASIPPPLDLDLTPTDPAASFTLELPGPDAVPEPAPMAAPTPSRRPRISGMVTETRPPSSYDPRAEPESPIVPTRASVPEIRSAPTPSKTPSRPAPARRAISSPVSSPVSKPPPIDDRFGAFGAEEPVTKTQRNLPFSEAAIEAPNVAPTPSPTPSQESRIYMRGASMPPFRLENPPPLLPKAPLLPKVPGEELAEHLSLPPGVASEGRSLEALPTSVLEARIQFTLLSRELGLDYRLRRGIELRADAAGIEAMQAVLAEMFPDRLVKTKDDAFELRRHGAFLSEILARRLDAEWMDISAPDLGHWVMIVPPDTRIWPFGRVGRFISMGPKERDLVSYFFELSMRARPR